MQLITINLIEMNRDKHIWEGWTVGDFINELEPIFDLIESGKGLFAPFTSKKELKNWCISNQPYYKKYIPDVVNYFIGKAKNVN